MVFAGSQWFSPASTALLFHLLYAIETRNNDEFPSALIIWHAEETLINGVEKRLAPLLVYQQNSIPFY
jgi:hypothetical protein